MEKTVSFGRYTCPLSVHLAQKQILLYCLLVLLGATRLSAQCFTCDNIIPVQGASNSGNVSAGCKPNPAGANFGCQGYRVDAVSMPALLPGGTLFFRTGNGGSCSPGGMSSVYAEVDGDCTPPTPAGVGEISTSGVHNGVLVVPSTATQVIIYVCRSTGGGNPNLCLISMLGFRVTDIVTTGESCAGANDGTITATATLQGGALAGVATYSINGVGGSTANTTGVFTGLAPGNYTVTVYDSGNPAFAATRVVTVPPASSPDINLQGNGLDILDGDLNPTPADGTDMGVTTAGVPIVKTFTIQNKGSQNLSVTSISSSSGNFTVSGLGLPVSIAPGGSRTFSVTFLAGAAGVYTGDITILSNDCDEPSYDYRVRASIGCTPPAFVTCPTARVVPTAPNACNAIVDYTVDITGATSVTYTLSGATIGNGSGTGSGSVFNKGVTTVTITASSACGSTVCSFNVTVQDLQAPTINCPANIIQNADPNLCSALVTFADATASDNCPGVTITKIGGPVSGTVIHKGSINVVTYKATDGANLMTTCTFSITVVDAQPPSITCPANIATTTAVGVCSATVNYTTPTGSDNCETVTITRISGPAPGGTFPLGSTTVIWQATDGTGLTKTCSFRVIVSDNQPPTITCPTVPVVNASTVACSAVVNYTTPTATDNCSTPVVIRTKGMASGSTFSVGNSTIIWRAIDGAGRTATCSFVIRVVDNTPPNITCPGNINVTQNSAGSVCTAPVVYPNPTVTDNCGVYEFNLVSGLASGSVFPLGSTTNTWRAMDVNNLTSTCAFTVTVTCTGVAGKTPGAQTETRSTITNATAPQLSISPNPVAKQAQFSVTNIGPLGGDLLVFDGLGRLKWRTALTETSSNVSVDMSGWPKGSYWVKVQTVQGVVTKSMILGGSDQ